MVNTAAFLLAKRSMGVRTTEMPKVGDDDVLIKMKYCGICGSDVHIYQHGEPGMPDIYPFIPGHEGAGEVIKLGQNVKTLKLGDRVCIEPGIPCRTCKWCSTGHYNQCPNIVFPSAPPAHGILRNYVSHPASLCFRLPDNVSALEGALIEPLAVGLNAARESGFQIGDSAVILGSGCIGLMTLLSLRAMGAGKVTVVDVFDIRLDKAKELGATAVVNAKQRDVVKAIDELYDGIGPDFVFEAAGNQVTASQSISLVRRGGTVMIVGNVTGQTPIDFQLMTNKEVRILTNFRYRNVYPAALEAIATGKIPVKSMVSRIYPLEEAPKGYEDCIVDGKAMVKAVIELDKEEL